MSTKTNFKRVALVAVAALGLGVLTSVAPASAADIATNEVGIKAVTAGSLGAVGVCSIASTAGKTSDALSSGTVVTVGATLSFSIADTTTDGSLSITGPAIWTAAKTGTEINSTATKLDNLTVTDTAGETTLKTTGVGSVTVTAKNNAGIAVKAISIAVVAACSSATTPVAANTLLGINSSQATTDGTDATLTYAEKSYGNTVWVNIVLRNGYKGDVSAGLLTATATNGALIKFDGTGGLASTAFVSTAATADEAMGLSVAQDQDTNPGKALTTTITFAFNGVTVGTKTVTILGIPASITISNVVGGQTGGTVDGSFEFVTKDNAGNSVESPVVGDITAEVTGWEAGDVVDGVTITDQYLSTLSFTTKGAGTFNCTTASTKSSGSVDVAIGFYDAALNVVKSNTIKAACGAGADTFAIALDKAVYSTGDIATLTITAKDALGAAVGDGTTVGEAIAADLAGMTPIGSAAASTDEFSGGVKTYKFRVDQNLGSFVGQAKITAATDTSAKTLQYKIGSSDTGTSLNDVLKAMVSLIASINKQIAALQKALLKKK
jgi:hypothetical protein